MSTTTPPRAVSRAQSASASGITPPTGVLVLDRSIYRGPNLYAGFPAIRFALDIGQLEQLPTDQVDGFVPALLEAIPSLREHRCSLGRPGGFVQRLEDGTWIGHVIEHVALELQTLVGHPTSRGKTRMVEGRPGVYNVLYRYADSGVGLSAGRLAIELVSMFLPAELRNPGGLQRLAPPLPRESPDGRVPGLTALTRMARAASLGPTTKSIVDAAERRGISWERADSSSLVRFGQGRRQRFIRASITDRTAHLAVEAAGDKQRTKQILELGGIPSPAGGVASSADQAVAIAASLRAPLVTKPLRGNHGKGVSLDLLNEADVRRGFEAAVPFGQDVIVEEQLWGVDHRILVVNDRVVAVAERRPPEVTGDGRRSIRDLVGELNADPRRGAGHENVLTRVRIDDHVDRVLAAAGYTADSVLAPGVSVALRENANLSTGATAIDRTDDIHPSTIELARRAARLVGLDVCGIDVLAPDISQPLLGSGGGVIEVNAAPGFRMHLAPSEGTPRDVGEAVIDMIYPRSSLSRIPVVSVTGTNGKSTTVRMISHILSDTGVTVGLTSTNGIYVDNRLVKSVDASGPRSARAVLRDPSVDAAVLETARGGMLREGLGYTRADVGIVLNVTNDHLGLGGINTVEQLAQVKGIVARNVIRRGRSILNADDPLTRSMAKRAGGQVAFFTLGSLTGADESLSAHVESGGILATIEDSPQSPSDEWIVLYKDNVRTPVTGVRDIPAALEGAARFNIANAMAAVLATEALGVALGDIAKSLATFESTFEQNPGRLNVTNAPGFTTIVDYAHNPAALHALSDLIESMRPNYARTIGVVSVPGDRRDEDIREIGRTAAHMFDELIFRERPDGRGRAAGGVIALLSEGAAEAGMDGDRVQRIMDEHEAIDAALRMAEPRDLVVVMPTNVDAVWNQVQTFGPGALA